MAQSIAAAPSRPGWVGAELQADECGLIAYWLGRREGALAPRLATVQFAALKPWLADLQIHERSASGRYLCRLSGPGCVQAMGADATGKHLDETVSRQVFDSCGPMFDRALATARPLRYTARLDVPGRGWRSYRQLLLPLRLQSGNCDTLVCLLKVNPTQQVLPPPPPDASTVLGSWELTEADLSQSFPEVAAAA